MYSEQVVNEGIRAFNGLKSVQGQWKLFDEIVFIYKGNIVKKNKADINIGFLGACKGFFC